MAAGNTYIPLATTTLSSIASSYTFSSISGSYTDLVLVGSNLKSDTNDRGCKLQFNGDTTSTYAAYYLIGYNNTVTAARDAVQTFIQWLGFNLGLSTTTNVGTIVTNILNYSNTTKHKTVLNRGSYKNNTLGPESYSQVSTWRSTAAITSITVSISGSGSFAVGSSFTLYGIAAA